MGRRGYEMNDLILALDFGGTKLTAATVARSEVLSGGREWLARQRVFSPANADAQFDISTIVTLGKQILKGAAPQSIGVSFGGPANYATGMIRRSDHVPGWENTPLKRLLEGEFAAPVRLDNDANVAALGEQQFGAGKGYQDLLYITVSTGVGGGWFLFQPLPCILRHIRAGGISFDTTSFTAQAIWPMCINHDMADLSCHPVPATPRPSSQDPTAAHTGAYRDVK